MIDFWAKFTKLYPELKDNVGIILDIQAVPNPTSMNPKQSKF
jgi:hypothetical protein